MSPIVSITSEETFSSRNNRVMRDGFIFKNKNKKNFKWTNIWKDNSQDIEHQTIKNGWFLKHRKQSETYGHFSLASRELYRSWFQGGGGWGGPMPDRLIREEKMTLGCQESQGSWRLERRELQKDSVPRPEEYAFMSLAKTWSECEESTRAKERNIQNY